MERFIIGGVYVITAGVLVVMSYQLRRVPPADAAVRILVGAFITFVLYRAALEMLWPQLRDDLTIRLTVGLLLLAAVSWTTHLAAKAKNLPLSRQIDELGHDVPISDTTKEAFREAVERRDAHDAANRQQREILRAHRASRGRGC